MLNSRGSALAEILAVKLVVIIAMLGTCGLIRAITILWVERQVRQLVLCLADGRTCGFCQLQARAQLQRVTPWLEQGRFICGRTSQNINARFYFEWPSLLHLPGGEPRRVVEDFVTGNWSQL